MKKVELWIEHTLFLSRWLMTPFFFGLVIALFVLLYSFGHHLFVLVVSITTLTENEAILGIISLIDMSLAAMLLFIVVFSGYENFVSKMDIGDHEDSPDWKSGMDFSAMKLKLVSSMVAISGIHLLKVFMEIGKTSENEIKWMLFIHLSFVVSGVLLALMDFIAAKAKAVKK